MKIEGCPKKEKGEASNSWEEVEEEGGRFHYA